MKNYSVQPNDTFTSVAEKFKIKNADYLRINHNLNCAEEDIMHDKLIVGKELVIPDDPNYLIDENEIQEVENWNNVEEENSKNKEEEKEEKEEKEENSTSEHDGKYFIIQKGTCQCNQGFKFPQLKVTSHQKHYWNSPDSDSDYLAVTENDLQFNPSAQPFGQCKLRPSSSGYLPCVYAPAGKWLKAYEKVKVLDKSCLTEISELMCTTGGKITIKTHGQQSETGKNNVNNANPLEQQAYNPVMDYEEFKDVVSEDYEDYY